MKKIPFIAIFALLTWNACTTSEVLEKTHRTDDPRKRTILRLKSAVSASGETKEPPLPIHIYVFDADETCVAMQTLEEESEAYQIDLPKGSYDVYALAGATTGAYSLPSQKEAKLSSPITLKNSEGEHAALEMGKSTNAVNVTTDKEEEATCNIQIKNIFAQLNVKLTQVPTGTKAITVAVSNLCSTIQLDGTVSGSEGKTTVVCTNNNEEENIWSAPATLIFPGMENSKTKISIQITNSTDVVKTFVVNGTKCPESNAPYNLNLNLNAAKGILSGNISSSNWNEPIEENISIDLETPQDGTSLDLSSIPEEGTVWNDCLVMNVSNTRNDGTSADILLMSTKEWENIERTEEAVSAIESSYSVRGLTGWKAFTKGDILDKINNLVSTKGLTALNSTLQEAGKTPLDKNKLYILREKETRNFPNSYIGQFTDTSFTAGINYLKTFYLRLVKEYHLEVKAP